MIFCQRTEWGALINNSIFSWKVTDFSFHFGASRVKMTNVWYLMNFLKLKQSSPCTCNPPLQRELNHSLNSSQFSESAPHALSTAMEKNKTQHIWHFCQILFSIFIYHSDLRGFPQPWGFHDLAEKWIKWNLNRIKAQKSALKSSFQQLHKGFWIFLSENQSH